MTSILRLALPLLALCLLAGSARAQLEANLGALEDDNAEGYLSPLSTALSATLNSSIFNTGYVPRTGFSFHIQANVMGVTFDDEDRTYRPVPPAGFQPSPSDADIEAPTVIGDPVAVAQEGQNGTLLYHPGGFDLEEFTVATPQLEISGVLGSRAIVRWIALELGDADLGELELFGVGLQHSLSQYFVEPPIDLAIGGFFQSFKIGDGLIDSQALQVMLTGSRAFGVFEPYLGLGYDSFDMESEYTSDDGEETISVDFDPESNVHFTAGARLNLQYVQLHGEFNAGAETGVAVGLGLGY